MADDVYDKYSAKVIFDNALKSGELNKQLAQLRKVSGILKEASFSKMLLDPKVAYADKAEALTNRLGEIDILTLKMVLMLATKGKLEAMEDINDEYQHLLDSYHGVEGAEVVEVTTAVPLDEKEKLNLSQRLTDALKKPIRLKATVDPELIGGIIIKIGDKLIDGSTRSMLGKLKREIT